MKIEEIQAAYTLCDEKRVHIQNILDAAYALDVAIRQNSSGEKKKWALGSLESVVNHAILGALGSKREE